MRSPTSRSRNRRASTSYGFGIGTVGARDLVRKIGFSVQYALGREAVRLRANVALERRSRPGERIELGRRDDAELDLGGHQLPHPLALDPDGVFVYPGGRVVDFGFPNCYGQGGPACAGVPAPLVTFPSHSTPEGVVVKDDVAYVADYGSSLPRYPAPTEIVRVDLRTGHVNVFWRSPVPHDLVGLTLGPDGNLYVPLLISGKVLRFDL